MPTYMRNTHLGPRLGAALLALLLAAGALGAACTDPLEEAPPRAVEPLKIGLLVDFSGGLAIFTDEMRLGFELAVDHVNAAGGVLGRPLRVLIIDSRLDPEHALSEARRMVDRAGVHALVGPLSSLLALPIAEQVSGPAGVPQIALGTSPALSSAADNDFLFRTTLSDTTTASGSKASLASCCLGTVRLHPTGLQAIFPERTVHDGPRLGFSVANAPAGGRSAVAVEVKAGQQTEAAVLRVVAGET